MHNNQKGIQSGDEHTGIGYENEPYSVNDDLFEEARRMSWLENHEISIDNQLLDILLNQPSSSNDHSMYTGAEDNLGLRKRSIKVKKSIDSSGGPNSGLESVGSRKDDFIERRLSELQDEGNMEGCNRAARDEEWGKELVSALEILEKKLKRVEGLSSSNEDEGCQKDSEEAEKAEYVQSVSHDVEILEIKCDKRVGLYKLNGVSEKGSRTSGYTRAKSITGVASYFDNAKIGKEVDVEARHFNRNRNIQSGLVEKGYCYYGLESAPASLASSPIPHDLKTEPSCIETPHGINRVSENKVIDLSDHKSLPTPELTPPMAPGKIIEQKEPLHFPHKPMLFNIARFATIAFSSYGARFMSVVGMDGTSIDIQSLLSHFGDSADAGLDSSDESEYSDEDELNMDYGASTLMGKFGKGEEKMAFSNSSRQSPEVRPYHKGRMRAPKVTPKPATPKRLSVSTEMKRRSSYGRRSFDTLSLLEPEERLVDEKRNRYHLRRPPIYNIYKRQLINEHPNHVSFCRHTGIPIQDLLFSSYVKPLGYTSIIPELTGSTSNKEKASERYETHKDVSNVDNCGCLASCVNYSVNCVKSIVPNQVSGLFSPKSASQTDSKSTELYKYITSMIPDSFLGVPLDKIKNSCNETQGNEKLPENTLGSSSRSGGDDSEGSNFSKNNSNHASKAHFAGKSRRKPCLGKGGTPVANAETHITQDNYIKKKLFELDKNNMIFREPSIHAPVHYIAVDHATRSVVLAIRGTMGVSDFVIDLLCEYVKISLINHPESKRQEFKAHSGMWTSACLLADPKSEVFIEISEALKTYPRYGLVLCGHSLGGGVASLLSILWSKPVNDPKYPYKFVTSDLFGLVTDRPIACYNYGSPCVANINLSSYIKGLVVSIVNSNDIFSYISVGSLADIIIATKTLGNEKKTVERIVKQFITDNKNKLLNKLSPFNIELGDLDYELDEEKLDISIELNDKNIRFKNLKNINRVNNTPVSSQNSTPPKPLKNSGIFSKFVPEFIKDSTLAKGVQDFVTSPSTAISDAFLYVFNPFEVPTDFSVSNLDFNQLCGAEYEGMSLQYKSFGKTSFRF
ncbi:Mono- and diacylglycerol lipase [Zancudomyces culisetae]|uniref:sn-1-specific diacylglycerol lipase n=1 Tax=Zancudomyces culisetae TaxID=1213189 RepID=A0A1R1PN03_ZANCU|nr:Mono- and diacylglycerol lipase [Zancudomyces culisetae]|eukprot:OMH82283.1 Mono- and diacylglycerol lipase [Zancudomyces culisetae]